MALSPSWIKRLNNLTRVSITFWTGVIAAMNTIICPPAADRVFVPRLKRVSLSRGPVQQTLELELELSTSLSLAPNRKSRSQEKVTIPITTDDHPYQWRPARGYPYPGG